MMDDEGSENNPGESEGEKKNSASDAEASAEKKELTPEEQMAQYEEALKDEDWGHQPC